MKKLITKKFIVSAIAVIFITSLSAYLYSFTAGFTGRTKKTSTAGCSCHNASPNTEVQVTISGPDTVVKSQTALYTLTISKSSKNGAGLNIAARTGTLSPVSSSISLVSGELTNNTNIPMPSGSVTVQFNYTAPSVAGTDTLYATGLATNSDGSASGDDWNWSPNKRIIVKNSVGIEPVNSNVPAVFSVSQNYPNPFNPETNIKFEVAKTSPVKIKIFDLTGKTVETLVNANLEAGTYEIKWNASKYSSGIYFYTFETKNFSQTRKMLLVK